MAKLKPPFGWIGGKSQLAADIVDLIPKDHKLYVEVFGGALNVFYRKLPSDREVVNDINGELINLHRVIKTNPQSLSTYLNQMLISRNLFYAISKGNLKPRNKIERAAYYYYLISQSFGCSTKTFAMNAKTRKPKNIYRDFFQWSKRLKYVTIEEKSFDKLIDDYNKDDAFFYCDPPYVGTEHYYKNTGGFSQDQHKLLAQKLLGIKGKFLVSYNDCELVRELYKGCNIVETRQIDYRLGSNVHKKEKKVREILIKNY